MHRKRSWLVCEIIIVYANRSCKIFTKTNVCLHWYKHHLFFNSIAVCNGQENCCHKDNKCGENEGDCNSDSDCKEGLKCGSNNCAQTKRIVNQTSFWDADDDCCYQPSCFKQNPCGELEGDCNTLSDCEVGLVCGSNNCPEGKNFLPDDDCCYKPIGKCTKPLLYNRLKSHKNVMYA